MNTRNSQDQDDLATQGSVNIARRHREIELAKKAARLRRETAATVPDDEEEFERPKGLENLNIAARHREIELAKKAARLRRDNPSPSSPLSEDGAEGGGSDVDPSDPASLAAALGAGASMAQIMLVKLAEDRRRLTEIQSVEAKIIAKREQILPDYAAWLEGLMAAKDDLPVGEPDDVLTTLMMWHIDVGHVDLGLDIAEIVLAKSIPLPSKFNRTAGTAIAEEVAEGAFAALRTKPDHEALLKWFGDITRAQMITAGQDMPDQVRAKLFKAEAQIVEAMYDRVAAQGDSPDGSAGALLAAASEGLAPARRALELDPTCGVKGIIAKFERALKKADAAADAQISQTGTTPDTQNGGT